MHASSIQCARLPFHACTPLQTRRTKAWGAIVMQVRSTRVCLLLAGSCTWGGAFSYGCTGDVCKLTFLPCNNCLLILLILRCQKFAQYVIFLGLYSF